MINIKKIMGNRIDSHVIAAHSLNKPDPNRKVIFGQKTPQLSEIERKLFSMFTASAEGYLRLFKVKEQKNLEIST